MSELGQQVRRLREERDWSQAKLAVEAGMAVSAVSQIETGKRSPSATSLSKLAAALEVEVRDLFPKVEAPPLFGEQPEQWWSEERREESYLRRTDPQVMAWLKSLGAEWGVLSEAEFSARFSPDEAAPSAAENARAEETAFELDAENARIMRELSREFVQGHARLFPDSMERLRVHRKLREDIHRHYSGMVLALVNYAARLERAPQSRRALLDDTLAEAKAA